MKKRFFKDFYGCTASISQGSGKFVLRVSNGYRVFYRKSYTTFKGARIAMGRLGDGWQEAV